MLTSAISKLYLHGYRVKFKVGNRPLDTGANKGSRLRGWFLEGQNVANGAILEKFILGGHGLINDKVKFIPRPFILEPPGDDKRLYAPGEEYSFGLYVIGQANESIPEIMDGLDALNDIPYGVKHSLMRLEKIEKIMPENYSGNENTFTRSRIDFKGLKMPDDPVSEILIQTCTRIRIRENTGPKEAHLVDEITFPILVKHLGRRIINLANYFCGAEVDFEEGEFLQKAAAIETVLDLHWAEKQRYSSRQQEWMQQGGVEGTIIFRGVLNEFVPMLKVGEMIRVGKDITQGLGQFKILNPE